MIKILKLIFVISFLLFATILSINAQNSAFNDGDLDTSFGSNGLVETPLEQNEFQNWLLDVIIQPDNKILAVGKSETNFDGSRFILIRYNSDGSIDTNFGNNGKVITQIRYTSFATSVVLQPDGKILVAGAAIQYETETENNSGDFTIVRYNANGIIDSSFGTNGLLSIDFGFIEGFSFDIPYKMFIQPDEKIVIVGTSIRYQYLRIGELSISLVRLNANGSLDETFGYGGKVLTEAGLGFTTIIEIVSPIGVSMRNDGKILVGTAIRRNQIGDTGIEGATERLIFRYNNDGTIDSEFAKQGVLTLSGVAIYQTIKSTSTNDFYTVINQFRTEKYDSNGKLNTDFAFAGSLFPTIGVYDLVTTNDGKLILGGGKRNSNDTNSFAAVARYDSNGTLDQSFGIKGIASIQIANKDLMFQKLVIQSDGKILAAGYSNTDRFYTRFFLARFLLNNNSIKSSKLSETTLKKTRNKNF